MGLEVVGLDAEREALYTALVARPRSTASALAADCGLSASRAGRLLAALVRDGLAIRSAGRPPTFTASAPDVAVTALIQEREHRLDAARSLVHRLSELHREAQRITAPDLAVELLNGRDDVSAAVRRLYDGARRQVRTFDRPPYIDRPGSNLEHQVERQRTGVLYRVLYDRAAVAWPGRLLNDILPSVRSGEQARVRAELPLKLLIADDHTAIIPLSLAPGGHSAAYQVHHSPMLTALGALFEAEWERALPLFEAERALPPSDAVQEPNEPNGPDAETRALLALLASGATDAVIARTQGWSQRTTQRRIHRLMTDLGAATRFQAAALAVRRGWL
ncbi:helix-turn-helix domain-containing protein [Actinomadura rupiterrae]|uniref:helix-turn-helix domain-containing protein n=1 Tax=Actinomadura rupiterrae TaxID=559627 RepID=UPI0020A5DA17|nr:helix-turn-helix domain-containing protein [Actinomadura rupiterrae]MCP2338971.1 DNA-binding CsgD family transcriptional regulator [Actinomadura rupiterrae]